ncbi:heparin lyase I family protein [Roseibium algae]|uniref:Heparin lyase I family protein n=1 Tax=Roseibium algae TaxID=3123038 RepID=A0ABU8TKF4_9HYPH
MNDGDKIVACDNENCPHLPENVKRKVPEDFRGFQHSQMGEPHNQYRQISCPAELQKVLWCPNDVGDNNKVEVFTLKDSWSSGSDVGKNRARSELSEIEKKEAKDNEHMTYSWWFRIPDGSHLYRCQVSNIIGQIHNGVEESAPLVILKLRNGKLWLNCHFLESEIYYSKTSSESNPEKEIADLSKHEGKWLKVVLVIEFQHSNKAPVKVKASLSCKGKELSEDSKNGKNCFDTKEIKPLNLKEYQFKPYFKYGLYRNLNNRKPCDCGCGDKEYKIQYAGVSICRDQVSDGK